MFTTNIEYNLYKTMLAPPKADIVKLFFKAIADGDKNVGLIVKYGLLQIFLFLTEWWPVS